MPSQPPRPFLVMELLGCSLHDLLYKGGREVSGLLNQAKAVMLALNMANGLAYLHSQRVVHRWVGSAGHGYVC